MTVGRLGVVIGVVAALGGQASCASTPRATESAARVAEYPRPDIPAGLVVPADVRTRHLAAWTALQALDVRRATAEFEAILTRQPAFYPARAGLGFAQLAQRQYRVAEATFAAIVREHDRYVPAWAGRAEALLGAGRQGEALDVLERWVLLDPRRESARTRLEIVRVRVTQDLVDQARRARASGRLDEARRHLDRAFSIAPSAAILREIVGVELAAGDLDQAEAHARRAIALDPKDGQGQAWLGDVLEAKRNYRAAADAYTRAAALDPRPAWTTRALDLREKAEAALLPASFARLAASPRLTRGEVAAYVGIHLDAVVIAAPARVTDVAVDVRSHWAATWIVPLSRAGIMTIQPNHTFKPDAVVDRAELARVASALVRLAGAGRAAELAKWRAARPVVADVPAGHAAYAPVALAITAGAMTTDADGRFAPARDATGRELEILVRRIAALGSR